MNDIDHIIETALANQRTGKLDEAAEIYRKILEIEPSHADAMHLLGMVCHAQGSHDYAIELIAKAILLEPVIAEFHINIASVYLNIGNPSQAKSHAQTAIKIDERAGEAHFNLGNALFAEGDVEAAVEAFFKAVDIDRQNQTYWANYLFALNFSPAATPQDIVAANKKWGEMLEATAPAPPAFSNLIKPDRQLRLAYFLPELDSHVTTRFLKPILDAHDRQAFEVYVYGFRTDKLAPPAAIIDLADHWIDVGGKSAAEVAAIMRSDHIDILAHPCTFKSRYREVLTQRAAPVQIACTNLVSTTGLAATDYLITDDFISPPELADTLFTEQLIRLSGFNTYQQIEDAGDVAPLPALVNGYITFGSCNIIAKLSPAVITAWAEILTKAVGSKLLLKHRAFDDAARRALISDAFTTHGIAAKRLIFEGFTANPGDYLNVYHDIDIALDPFPFGGGTVSYESLWMGVPIVTLAGEVFMGRLTGSLLHRLGLDNFITTTSSQYIETAVSLSEELDALAKTRASLRLRAQATIFDASAHVQELEAAFKDAWRTYCQQTA